MSPEAAATLPPRTIVPASGACSKVRRDIARKVTALVRCVKQYVASLTRFVILGRAKDEQLQALTEDVSDAS